MSKNNRKLYKKLENKKKALNKKNKEIAKLKNRLNEIEEELKDIKKEEVKNKKAKIKNAKLDIKKPKIKEDSKIFELEKNTIVGTYQKSRNFGFVVPDDKKLGTDIYIAKKDAMKAKNNQKVVVEITKLPRQTKVLRERL